MTRLVRSALVAASCLITAHGTLRARASSSTPERVPSDAWCALSRSPILPPVEAMPEPLRCYYDEDGNGLDDDVERELARCFAPELRFDAGEPARAPNEPHVLYNVRRPSSEPGRLRIAFTLLYARDAGFPESFLCGGATRHPGDTEPLEIKVRLVQGYKGFYAHVEQLEIGAPGGPSWLGAFERSATSPTRPVVYVSRGKHHLYTRPYDGPYRGSPIGCRDIARGDGARIVPGMSTADADGESFAEGPTPALDHVPVFDDRGMRGGRGSAPLGPGRGRWWNACLAALHPDEPEKWRLATRSLRPNRFGLLPGDPFPGEEIQADRFGGGLGVADAIVTPIWRTLRLNEPMAEESPMPEVPTAYVAGGGAGFGGTHGPSWNAADDLSPPLLVPPWKRGGSRGGLLDGDGDGLVDVEDDRPTTPSIALPIVSVDEGVRLAGADVDAPVEPPVAPDVTPTAETVLVEDPRNGTAALVDLERGIVLGWDPVASAWIRSTAPLDGIRGRRGSALALVGATLFVVGGERDGVVLGDAFALDVFGKQTTVLGERFPPRRGARLTLASDGRGLVLQGGVDDDGQECSGTWVADFAGPRALATARRAFGRDGDALSAPDRPTIGGWLTSGT